MEKNKKLIKKEGEASDKELENVSGGTEITVLGQWGNWYVVRYGDKTGYVHSAYVAV